MNPTTEFTRDVIVNLENGLHLVPSSQIVKLAQKFASDIRLRKGDRVVDGKSVLELITLAAEHGEVLQLQVQGADAAEALEAIAGLFERNFDNPAA